MKKWKAIKQIVVCCVLASIAGLPNSYAKEGGANGGGGDYTETLINDIRADILSWISIGGASQLKFPVDVTYEDYVKGMNYVLAPHRVVIGSITTAEEEKTNDPDLKVEVNGQPKTCRGSIWKKDGLAHILCNIERFQATPENERYPLVHHEYAGLATLEKNVGASSDYVISNQISGFLEKKEVLRLVVKSSDPNSYDNQERTKALTKIASFAGKTIRNQSDLFFISAAAKKYCGDETMISYEGLVLTGDAEFRNAKVTYWKLYMPKPIMVEFNIQGTHGNRGWFSYSYSCPLK